jgi:outer membrane protein assembly factor BamB/orotate phosphoribosyltransferase
MYDFVKRKILNDCINLGFDFLDSENTKFHFDNRKLFLTTDGSVLPFIGNEMWNKIKHLNPEVLYTKGIAGYPLLLSIKEAASKENKNLTCFYIRSQRKSYALRKIIEGPEPNTVSGKRAIFIDDLFNSGSTFENTKKTILEEDFELDIVGVCVLVDFWRIYGSRKYNISGFPVMSIFRRHDFGLTREDHNLKQIVKSLKWRTNNFHTGRNILKWKGAPVLHNDLLLIGSDNGHHYCFDKNSGNLKWTNKSENPQPKGDVSVTQFHNGKAYWSSYDGTVKCCDVNTGKNIWTVKVDLNLHSSPTLDIKNDRLFIGTEYNKFPMESGGFGEGDVVCLKMSDGQELWRFKTGGMIPCCVGYSEKNNTVITGSNDFNVYVLNAGNGHLIKKIPTKGEVKGKIVVSKDGLKAIGVSIQGYAYCVCTETGNIIWTKRIGFEALHCYPLIFDNFVCITNNAGVVSCIDMDSGEIVWLSQCRDDLGWGLIDINKDTLLGITEKGQLHTFNKKTGEKLSNDDLSKIVGEDVIILQPPDFDGKNVYVVSNNLGLFSFNVEF